MQQVYLTGVLIGGIRFELCIGVSAGSENELLILQDRREGTISFIQNILSERDIWGLEGFC